MPATTPRHDFPYPLGPDPIDAAGDVQRLAEAVDGHVYGELGYIDANDTLSGMLQIPTTILTVTVDIRAGRRIMASGFCNAYKATADLAADVQLTINGTAGVMGQNNTWVQPAPPPDNAQHGLYVAQRRTIATAGTYVFDLQLQTGVSYVNATFRTLAIDDLGPA